MLLIINADDPYLSSVAEDPGTLEFKISDDVHPFN